MPSPAENPAGIAQEAPRTDDYPVPRMYAWYLLGLLLLLSIFGQMDRMIIGTLFPLLKKEWDISDTSLGMLVSATYWAMATLVIPAALLADRWSRTRAIGLMGILWSCATMACGTVGNFTQLIVARVAIGAGEAGYFAGAISMISSVFPERIRTTVISLFVASGTLGIVVGLGIGGYVASRWGWREAFFIVATPGFAVVLLFMLTARDYQTLALEIPDGGGRSRKLRLAELLGNLFATPSLLCLYAGLIGVMFINSSVIAWAPSLFTRAEGLSMGVASIYSALLGPAIFMLISSACYFLGFTHLEGSLRLAALMVGAFFVSASFAPISAASMSVVHPGLRATAIGVFNIIGQLIGGTGPIVVGIFSDGSGLSAALAMASLAPAVSAVFLFTGARHFAADAARIPATKITLAAHGH